MPGQTDFYLPDPGRAETAESRDEGGTDLLPHVDDAQRADEVLQRNLVQSPHARHRRGVPGVN